MTRNEHSEAVVKLAEGILMMNFPDGVPGIDRKTSDEYIQKFVSQEIAGYDTGKLTSETLVLLFEKYCELEQMKSALR